MMASLFGRSAQASREALLLFLVFEVAHIPLAAEKEDQDLARVSRNITFRFVVGRDV